MQMQLSAHTLCLPACMIVLPLARALHKFCGSSPSCGVAQAALNEYLIPDASELARELDRNTSPGFKRLNKAVAQLMDEWSMVAFVALDYSDEESIGDVLAQIDHCIQWGEDADVKIRDLGMGEMGGEDT